MLGEVLVESEKRPAEPPVFARTGIRVMASFDAEQTPEQLAESIAARVRESVPSGSLVLQAFTPDSPAGNRLADEADSLRKPCGPDCPRSGCWRRRGAPARPGRCSSSCAWRPGW